MTRDGTKTRERILDSAERLVLDQGLAGTSIDQMLADAGTSKGAFFHHFPSKNHLARALVERYAANDVGYLEEYMARVEAETDDPAEQVVAFIRLFEETADEMVEAAAELPLRLLHLRQAAVRRRHERHHRRRRRRLARAAGREAAGGGRPASANRPGRPRRARRPHLRHVRRGVRPRTHDGRPRPDAAAAGAGAPLRGARLRRPGGMIDSAG